MTKWKRKPLRKVVSLKENMNKTSQGSWGLVTEKVNQSSGRETTQGALNPVDA